MADEHVHTGGPEPPPAGEAIHLPGPSYLPVLTAFGLTITIVSIVISWVLVAVAGVFTVVMVWRWIRETRRDISELPLEHR